jgi:hypothetical protein
VYPYIHVCVYIYLYTYTHLNKSGALILGTRGLTRLQVPKCMRPEDTSVCGLELLLYAALSYYLNKSGALSLGTRGAKQLQVPHDVSFTTATHVPARRMDWLNVFLELNALITKHFKRRLIHLRCFCFGIFFLKSLDNQMVESIIEKGGVWRVG